MSTSRPSTVRKSGRTQAEEVAIAASKANDDTESSHEDVEREMDSPRSKFRSVGFTRFKTQWSDEDIRIVTAAKAAVDERIQHEFRDAFQVMHDIYIAVREPVVDDDGEPILDAHGWPQWKRTASGGWVEDWSALGRRQREDLLFALTTRLFAWEQAAADAWAEAMFAKAKWEETFSHGYANPAAGTVDDRTAAGRTFASEERYFAVFLTHYSKKADAICRTMSLLAQRLKDTFDLS